MRKLMFMSLLISGFLFGACEKDTPVDVPGNIPGMGDNTAALEVKPVDLPENVSVVGVIKGYEESNKSASLFPDFKLFGSGCNYVTVEYTLRNDNNFPVTVFIPPGTIFKSSNPAYQHGILLQWVWVVIPAKSQRTVVLYLYCINDGKYNSDSSVTFEMVGRTLSKPILGLLDLLTLKKINYEFYDEQSSREVYELTKTLQDAIWGLTNYGNSISNEVKGLINGLPSLDKDVIPEAFYNNSATLPVYFDEYEVR